VVAALDERGVMEQRIMPVNAHKNCIYLIDIITLLQFTNLTNPSLYVYAVEYVHSEADAEHPDGTTLLAHGRAR
jgi:hypothetical protein